jgi:hypothetical protein
MTPRDCRLWPEPERWPRQYLMKYVMSMRHKSKSRDLKVQPWSAFVAVAAFFAATSFNPSSSRVSVPFGTLESRRIFWIIASI